MVVLRLHMVTWKMGVTAQLIQDDMSFQCISQSLIHSGLYSKILVASFLQDVSSSAEY